MVCIGDRLFIWSHQLTHHQGTSLYWFWWSTCEVSQLSIVRTFHKKTITNFVWSLNNKKSNNTELIVSEEEGCFVRFPITQILRVFFFLVLKLALFVEIRHLRIRSIHSQFLGQLKSKHWICFILPLILFLS